MWCRAFAEPLRARTYDAALTRATGGSVATKGERVNPGGGLVTMVNARLADDGFRQQIRTMHAEQKSLIDMVQALGLAPEMSPEVRTILEGLGKAEIEGIRQATLEMLDRAENAMPLDCKLSQSEIDAGAAVAVAVVDEAGKRTVRVRATG